MASLLSFPHRAWCRLVRGHRWALIGSQRQFVRCIFCPAWRHRRLPD